jgi:hypothetical protein
MSSRWRTRRSATRSACSPVPSGIEVLASPAGTGPCGWSWPAGGRPGSRPSRSSGRPPGSGMHISSTATGRAVTFHLRAMLQGPGRRRDPNSAGSLSCPEGAAASMRARRSVMRCSRADGLLLGHAHAQGGQGPLMGRSLVAAKPCLDADQRVEAGGRGSRQPQGGARAAARSRGGGPAARSPGPPP